MENQVMITVLNEVLAEQKEIREKNETMGKNIEQLLHVNERLEKKLDALPTEIPPVDLRLTEDLLAKNAEELKSLLAEQPKNITQTKRYLLFPEHRAAEYYNAILKWVLFIVIATYAFLLIEHLMDKWMK